MRPEDALRATTTARGAAGILLVLALGGCALLSAPERANRSVYRLAFDPTPAGGLSAADCGVLEVELPQAAPGFESSRMLYARAPYRLEAYAYSEWADTLPRMLLPALKSALEASGVFSAVVSVPAPVAADYRLKSSEWELLQTFEGDTSSLRLSAGVQIFASETRRVAAQRRLATERAGGADAAAGAIAANAALNELLTELIAMVRTELGPCTAGVAR